MNLTAPIEPKKMASKIELIPLNDLVPYANNARTHSDDQINQIVASMEEFGFTNPILIDKDEGIIAGHGRFEAATRLGLNKVPVIRLDHLTDIQKRAYILADNRLALNAGWDEELLSQELISLREDDFDLDLLGWSENELLDILPEEMNKNDEDVSDSDKKDTEKELGVMVLCKNESNREEIFIKLVDSGYSCRMAII